MTEKTSEDIKIGKIHIKDALIFGILIFALIFMLIIAFRVDQETFFLLMTLVVIIGILTPIMAILTKIIQKHEIFINPMILFAILGIIGILAAIWSMMEASQTGNIIWSITNLLFIVIMGSLLVLLIFYEGKDKIQVKKWKKGMEESWAMEKGQEESQIDKIDFELTNKRKISILITAATLVLAIIWLLSEAISYENTSLVDIYLNISQNPKFILLFGTLFVGIAAVFMVDMESKATMIAAFGGQIFFLILAILSFFI
ncbi:MAG: hypothetical protein ACFFDB_00370 [Promethearchaeota archaeon]